MIPATAARLGADDVHLFDTPLPDLLREITGIEPVPTGTHVRLDEARVRSTQRLALADIGGGIAVALWPAELQAQAEFLYQQGRAGRLIAAARERGWNVKPSPHLAFFNSRHSQRLYMDPDVSAEDYARRWEGPDGRRIGRHSPDEVRLVIWPWLKERGYAKESDDDVFEDFLVILGRRRADLRPGLRLNRRWDADAVKALGGRKELAVAVRRDVDGVLGAVGEWSLPASRRPPS